MSSGERQELSTAPQVGEWGPRTCWHAAGRDSPPLAMPLLAGGAGPRLATYLEIPFVHFRVILACLVVSLAAGWIALLVWPRSFESEAKLLIRVGRESVALDPTATTSETLMLQKTQEEEVNSALEVLSSRQVAERVVHELSEAAILDGVLPAEAGGRPADEPPPSPWKARLGWLRQQATRVLDFCLVASGVRDEISDHELAVMKLQKSVDIYAPKKSTVISVRAESKTPEMAQAIARATVETFLDQHLSVTRTEGSQEFFAHQAKEATTRLNELVERRSKFMQERQIVSIEANRGMLSEQLATIERDLIVARGELEQALAEIIDLQAKLLTTETEIVASKDLQSDLTWSGMRQRVYELELEERSLAAMYTDEHPKLVQVREQIEGARQILARLQSERVNRSMTPNPLRQRLEEELQAKQTRVAGLRSVLAEKQKQREEIVRAVDALLADEVELKRLDREIALGESSLVLLREKQEEARVIDELQVDRISNISVFQPATFVERAVKPNKKLVAAACLMLGLLGGLGLAFVREMGTESIRTPDHVLDLVGCPVLAAIPRRRELNRVKSYQQLTRSHELNAQCQRILAEVLLTRVQPDGAAVRGRTLGVMSISAGCGASTIATALAIASSEEGGLRTTLIDADLQSRTVSRAFGLNGAPGFAELLSGEANTLDCIQRVDERPLELISGSAPGVAAHLETEPRAIASALAEFQHDNDLVIVDLPPAQRPDQAMALAHHLDQILVVVEAERTGADQARRVVRRLGEGGAEIVGIVLNKTRHHLPWWIRRIIS